MTHAMIDDEIAALEKSLAEPPLTLRASGGGMKVETGGDFQEIILDGCVLLPRRRAEVILSLLRGICLTPADAPHVV